MSSLQLMPFQLLGVEFLLDRPRAILADDMGLGKTVQALMANERRGAYRQTLVLCPNSVRYVWQDEISKWTSRSCRVLEGTTKERAEQIRSSTEDYLILNYESAQRLQTDIFRPWGTIVADEAHRLKSRKRWYVVKNHHEKKMTTAGVVRHLATLSPYVMMLTGTPIPNRPEDLWSLLNILYPKRFSSFWRFVQDYCHVFHNGFGMEVGRLKFPERLCDDLEPYVLRREKSQVLDLPPKTHQTIRVDLDDDGRRRYLEMKKMMLVQLGAETIVAPGVLSQLLRLRQIAIDPELIVGTELTPLRGAKARAVLELLEDVGDQKVVIFSSFAMAIRKLNRLLASKKIGYETIYGDVSTSSRRIAQSRFEALSGIQVLTATTSAGGVGLTLTTATIVIFLDLPWTPAEADQAEDRTYRIGQTRPVTVYRLVAKETIDESILRLLWTKRDEALKAIRVADII